MTSEHKTSRRNFLTAATAAMGALALSPLSRAFAEPTTQPAAQNPFAAQEPTADRPYYYIRYDEKTKAANPKRSPTTVGLAHTVDGNVAWDEAAKGVLSDEVIKPRPGETVPEKEPESMWHKDKIIVLNYLAENSRYSTMQTELLQNTIKRLAADSKKPFLLVDVVAYDKNGKGIYHAETAAALEHNTLGKNGEAIKVDPTKDLIPPYGQIAGTSFEKGKENRVVQLRDFALLNAAGTPVTNDELLQITVKSIQRALFMTVRSYNQLAAANTANAPTFAALNRD